MVGFHQNATQLPLTDTNTLCQLLLAALGIRKIQIEIFFQQAKPFVIQRSVDFGRYLRLTQLPGDLHQQKPQLRLHQFFQAGAGIRQCGFQCLNTRSTAEGIRKFRYILQLPQHTANIPGISIAFRQKGEKDGIDGQCLGMKGLRQMQYMRRNNHKPAICTFLHADQLETGMRMHHRWLIHYRAEELVYQHDIDSRQSNMQR